MMFRCEFSGELYKYGGEASWWFIRLPVEDAEILRSSVVTVNGTSVLSE